MEKKRAVVVDDEKITGEIISQIVEELGYKVVFFNRPDLAIKYLEACGKLDLLISDFHMPSLLNGLELAKVAKEANSEIRRVIIMSGYPGRAIGESIRQSGFLFLKKPFGIASLQAMILD